MPKYEIEIPDGVLPEGTVPVAYRKPEKGEPYVNPFHSQQVSANGGGDMSKVEPRLIVAKRPEPKFKVGDKVRFRHETGGKYVTIRTADTYEGKSRYRLTYANGSQGTCYWFDDELEPYTEPPKPAKYRLGQIVTYRFGAYPEQQWVIRSFHRSNPGNNNVYKIAPVRPGHPVLNAEIFVDERDLSPYVEKPHPKFKVGDWISHTDKFMLGRVNSIHWNDTWGNWRYNCDGMPHAAGWPEEALRQTTRVPLTQDDAVKLALGEITPKDIQLEDKRLEASLAHCQAKQLGRNEAGPTLWLKDPKEIWDTAYPISDLTRLV